METGWRIFAPENAPSEEATVFFPGWGFDGAILQLVTPRPSWWVPETPLDPARMEQDFSSLRDGLPATIHLVGWSMGGIFALLFACRHPERTASLTLLGVRQNWPAPELALAHSSMCADWKKFVRDLHRRALAGFPRIAQTFVATQQKRLLQEGYEDMYLRGLDLLATALPRPPEGIAVCSVHGRRDQVVPVADMARFPGGTTIVLEKSGHLPLLDRHCPLHEKTRKQRVRRLFSRAAASYDAHALAQQQAGAMLLRLVRQQQAGFVTNVLELGCGTGWFTQKLAELFPDAALLALDFAPEMIAMARQNLGPSPMVHFCCKDGERFLQNAVAGSFDCITSVGAMQWFTDLPAALVQAVRALAAGGGLFLAAFGPNSLAELACGLGHVFGHPVSLPAHGFFDADRIREVLQRQPMEVTVATVRLVREYPDPRTLLAHIRKTGTGGTTARPLVLTRSRLTALEKWFQTAHNGCRVSYELIMVSGRKHG